LAERYTLEKAVKLPPPLVPGQEFYLVTELVMSLQLGLVIASFVLFFGLILIVVSHMGMPPQGVRKEWHNFELLCLQQPL
jgi:hypothetical protein